MSADILQYYEFVSSRNVLSDNKTLITKISKSIYIVSSQISMVITAKAISTI